MPDRKFTEEQLIRVDDPSEEPLDGFIRFGGYQINLNRLAQVERLNYSYLYRVFRGQRIPSMLYALTLARRLGMTLDTFYSHLEAQRLGQVPTSAEKIA
jgi:hypothetical protein